MNRRIFIFSSVLAVALAMIFVPFFRITVVPGWTLTLTYDDGSPVRDELVRQTWKDYSIEFSNISGNEETKQTDSYGTVVFPERTIQVSVLRLILSKIRDLLASTNIHSSYGSHSSIYCLNKSGCDAFYSEGETLVNQVIVIKANK